MNKKIIITTILALILCFIKSKAQVFNPYNLSYNLGAAIGQNIRDNQMYGRNQLRKAINKWNECANGTLSLKHGAVAIYGSNGYCCSAAVPDGLKDELKQINKKNNSITDVNITEGGYYIVISNDGNMWSGSMPSPVLTKLRELPNAEKIKSCSFNDNGIYALLTDRGFYSNNNEYVDFYEQRMEEIGECYSVNIYGNGAVYCFARGTDYCGSVPKNVVNILEDLTFKPKFVKFNSHGDYLICSSTGKYQYKINDANEGQTVSTLTKKPGPKIIKSNLKMTFYYVAYSRFENKETKELMVLSDNRKEIAITFDCETSPGLIYVYIDHLDATNNSIERAQTIKIDPKSSQLITNGDVIGIFYDNVSKSVQLSLTNKALYVAETVTSGIMDKYKLYLPLSYYEEQFQGAPEGTTLGLLKGIILNDKSNYHHEVIDNPTFKMKWSELKRELLRYPWKTKRQN